ncbi:hypothetical protein ACFSLT_07600 [Novosphingobium resinovorum]
MNFDLSAPGHRGRLSMLAAAWVVARRDFTAILFSRTFFSSCSVRCSR